jgi:hypothetical protein
LSLLCLTLGASAQNAPNGDWKFFGSWRLRQEYWSWFSSPVAQDTYSYTASQIRAGVSRQTSKEEVLLELESPALLNLPNFATAPAPAGQLGLGAAYRAASGGNAASLFLKQGYVRFKNLEGKGNSLRLGRFEFNDGLEIPTTDPSMSFLKRDRISQRLLGGFAFTHVGRSLDGVQVTSDRPNRNFTGIFAMPTRGVFSVRGMDTLTDIKVGYLAWSSARKSPNTQDDSRLFGVFYHDQRGAVKTDNRPLAARTADSTPLQIATIGAHSVRVTKQGSGKWDRLFWGAGQFGSWGNMRHAAFAGAAEIGYQPSKVSLNPWFRIGYYYASGDADGSNGQHGTFFPILPTPRIYARFPFFSENNIQDLFFQTILRPNARTTVRFDVHKLDLANGNDLWYTGGGAFENASFGYAGRPAGGKRDLGTFFDISVDYAIRKNLNATLYLGYSNGGNVQGSIYGDRNGFLGYMEMNCRF